MIILISNTHDTARKLRHITALLLPGSYSIELNQPSIWHWQFYNVESLELKLQEHKSRLLNKVNSIRQYEQQHIPEFYQLYTSDMGSVSLQC